MNWRQDTKEMADVLFRCYVNGILQREFVELRGVYKQKVGTYYVWWRMKRKLVTPCEDGRFRIDIHIEVDDKAGIRYMLRISQGKRRSP